MPELPEVEVTRQGLIPLLKKTISKVDVRNYSFGNVGASLHNAIKLSSKKT